MDETLLDYFDEEQLEKFMEAVTDGLGQFGADNQDVIDYFEIAAGLPIVEVQQFPSEPLALACRDQPVAEWERICRELIHRWVDGSDQRDWIAAQPFADVAGMLRPWLSNDPAYSTFVPNKAVATWGVSYEELLEATRQRLRSQEPPKWKSNFYHLADDESRYRIEMLYLEEAEETDPIAAAWQLILAEVAPKPLVPGTLIASPARQILMLSYPDTELTVEQRRVVFDDWSDRMWANFPHSRVQGWTLRVDPGDYWRIVAN